MSNIESYVLRTFLERIVTADDVSDMVVEGLHDTLTGDKLPKAERLVELFTSGSGDTLA